MIQRLDGSFRRFETPPVADYQVIAVDLIEMAGLKPRRHDCRDELSEAAGRYFGQDA